PSRKVTVPSAVPEAAVTVAVNVTGSATSVPPLDARVVVVAAFAGGFTVCVTGGETADALNDAPPVYWAVIVCVPVASADVVSVATPLAFTPPVPIDDPLSKNVTVPLVGVPPPDVIVAVNVTDWVKTDPAGALVCRAVVVAAATGVVIVTVNDRESLEEKF